MSTFITVFILAFAIAFSRYLTIQSIPKMVGELILGISSNPYVLLNPVRCAGTYYRDLPGDRISGTYLYPPLPPASNVHGRKTAAIRCCADRWNHAGHDDPARGYQFVCGPGSQWSKTEWYDPQDYPFPAGHVCCATGAGLCTLDFYLPA